MRVRLGRHVFGLAAIAFGSMTLTWHRIDALGNLSHPRTLLYIAGIAEVIGGLAVQWQRTVEVGAIILLTIFSIFSLYLVPPVFKTPLDFSPYGNFFEEFSILIGRLFILASTISSQRGISESIEREPLTYVTT